MSFSIQDFRTDTSKETDGVWVNAGAGLRLKIARMGNAKYKQYQQTLIRPLQEELSGVGEVSPEKVQEITRKAMAKHILLGWENLQDVKKTPTGDVVYVVNTDGKITDEPELVDVPYSVEKAEEFLALSDFGDMVARYAGKMELFRVELGKRQAKN